MFISKILTCILFLTASVSFAQHTGHGSQPVSETFAQIETHQAVNAGHNIQLQFRLRRRSSGVPIIPTQMIVHHEKLLHIVIYDEALKEFNHVHGRYWTNGVWTTEEQITLRKNGIYRISAEGVYNCKVPDITLQDECSRRTEVQFRVAARFQVINGELQNTPISPVYNGVASSGKYSVSYQGPNINALIVSGPDYSVNVERFLGAYVHLWYISMRTGNVVLHHHGERKTVWNAGSVHLNFSEVDLPEPGLYRVWAQFKIDGAIHTTPFVINKSNPWNHP